MAHDLVCWKCGASLSSLSLPLMRADTCPKCRADLHVCKMCVDYDTRVNLAVASARAEAAPARTENTNA